MSCLRGAFRDAFALGWKLRRCAICAVLASGTAFAAGHPARPQMSLWQQATAARSRFEAQPAHTRTDYARVMESFRAIYHGNPADVHAAAAVAQVAELLEEQGRELHDDKSLRDAAGQYEFLAKQYPASPLAPPALRAEVELFGSDGLSDAAEAKRAAVLLKKTYPRKARVLLAMKAPPLTLVARSNAPAGLRSAAPEPAEPAHTVIDSPKAVTGRKPITDVPDPVRALPAPSDLKTKTLTANGAVAKVTAIRHWSTANYTRVAIDLGDEVEYQAARVEHPDRIFFDLHHAHLAPELVGKSFSVTDDGFLTRIRAAQYADDVTRVVLDVHEITDYSAFLLPNPYRLIIDIHGKTAATEKPAGSTSAVVDDKPAWRGPVVAKADKPAQELPKVEASPRLSVDGAVSSLPPMPVTDGSAGFGLPPRQAATDLKPSTVAPPRVVIPVKPTASRPVPNTVASRSADTGTEVVAVSDQPGKVEATRRPTSAPISARSKDEKDVPVGNLKPAKVDLGTRTAAAPVMPPPPTADGETSLLRALGLKIGRIVIDAGHGGHDSGTLGADGIEEKDVVLDVALRLGKMLHQKLGAEIIYTRADDTFIPLETRTAIANKAQADLFISVHANSSPDPSARGVEVYYLNFTSDPEAMRVASRENAVSNQSVHELSDLVKKIALKDKIDESRELAGDVEGSLFAGLEKGNDGLKDRGVKKAPFVVLIGANMPSILAEISFVTNPDDAEQLRTPEYRQRVAESLFNGVARYASGINGVKNPSAKLPIIQRAAVRK